MDRNYLQSIVSHPSVSSISTTPLSCPYLFSSYIVNKDEKLNNFEPWDLKFMS